MQTRLPIGLCVKPKSLSWYITDTLSKSRTLVLFSRDDVRAMACEPHGAPSGAQGGELRSVRSTHAAVVRVSKPREPSGARIALPGRRAAARRADIAGYGTLEADAAAGDGC